MNIQISAEVQTLLLDEHYEFKMVFNDNAAVLFPCSSQHREMKASGLSYDDDSRGNALAAMMRKGSIEIRFHREFSDTRVGILMKKLLANAELDFAREFTVTYQSRPISVD